MKRNKLGLQFFAEDTDPKNGANGAPDNGGTDDGGQNNQSEKLFTQAELDAQIGARLARERKELPSAEELAAFKEWQETQKTEAQRQQGVIDAAQKERDAALSEKDALERKVVALSQGVPADKVDKYAKLAEAYMDDKTPFEKALEAALKDFPVASGGVPGTGANPPAQGTQKNNRPSGTVVF